MMWDGIWPPRRHEDLIEYVFDRLRKPIIVDSRRKPGKIIVFNFSTHMVDEESLARSLLPGVYVIPHSNPIAWTFIYPFLKSVKNRFFYLGYDNGNGRYYVRSLPRDLLNSEKLRRFRMIAERLFHEAVSRARRVEKC